MNNKTLKIFRIAYTVNIALFSVITFIITSSLVITTIINYAYFTVFIIFIIALHILIFFFTKSCYKLVKKVTNKNLDIATKDKHGIAFVFSIYSMLFFVYTLYLIWHSHFSPHFTSFNQKIAAQLFFTSAIVSIYVSIQYWIVANNNL